MVSSTDAPLPGRLTLADKAARPKLVGNALLGTILFIGAEAMLFAGLMSAFTIVKNSVSAGLWPPPGQPRLPFWETSLTTLALLVSGVVLFMAWRAYKASDAGTAQRRMLVALVLGTVFVVFQGYEWVTLLGQGLTINSSQLGSFFYVIVGCHGMHAIGALVALGVAYKRLRQGELSNDYFAAAALFWYFVVLVWPVVYLGIYR